MADEQDQGEPVSLGAIGLELNNAIALLGDGSDSHIRRDRVVDALRDLRKMVARGIYGNDDPKIKELQAENAELRMANNELLAEAEILRQQFAASDEQRVDLQNDMKDLRAVANCLEKRNAQMAATAQDGIDQRDQLRRERDDLITERNEALKDRDKWERYSKAILRDGETHIKEIRLRKEAHEETKQEVEHLKRELAMLQGAGLPRGGGDPIATAWGEMGRETQVAVDLETEDAIQTICLPPGSRVVAVIVSGTETPINGG